VKPQEPPKQSESKPPETKPQDANTPAAPTPPAKASESKAPDAPPPVKAPEAKAPETKAPETKPPDAKTPAVPSPPGKAAEPKAPDAPPSVKAPEGKAPETKGQDAKAPVPGGPPKTSEAKPPDAKPVDAPKPAGSPILAIKLALMADPRLFPYEVNVDMNGDVAVLTGKVGSDADKAAAADIVQGLEGVKSITNNLEVAKDLPQTLARKKDEIITQYVKDRFGKSKTLDTAHFDVKTEDGIVSLSGKTKFLVIALEAAEAARNVPGVKAVKSEGIKVEAGE
jgi:hyperosmotically inducible protein